MEAMDRMDPMINAANPVVVDIRHVTENVTNQLHSTVVNLVMDLTRRLGLVTSM